MAKWNFNPESDTLSEAAQTSGGFRCQNPAHKDDCPGTGSHCQQSGGAGKPAPTLAEALELPEIKALVEAADYILDGMAIDAPIYDIDPDEDFLDAANSKWVRDTLTRLATALRRIAEWQA